MSAFKIPDNGCLIKSPTKMESPTCSSDIISEIENAAHIVKANKDKKYMTELVKIDKSLYIKYMQLNEMTAHLNDFIQNAISNYYEILQTLKS